MQLSYATLKNKILGCYNGKNIGGTLGAPFEGIRAVHNVNFYTQKDIYNNPPPNDDLDLQIVWLNAVERFGTGVNKDILAEYWLTYIYPNWSEYGTGKANLKRGVMPPMSGRLENIYKDSCGSFIRSEIWACLAPGHPEISAVYAYHDACVDHADEGIWGEMFCASVQSAAFVESDIKKLLSIGLSYIPDYCEVAKAVRCVVQAYEQGLSWLDARDKLFNEVPGSFGLQTLPLDQWSDQDRLAKPGCDAPNNIGISIIGLLYGGGDFGNSICIAVNCGEDTDCTAGFLGALFGIVYGNDKLPGKWLNVLNGVINTFCIDRSEWGIFIPKSVEEFAKRILRNIPVFLQADFLGNPRISLDESECFSVEAMDADKLCRPKFEYYAKHLWRNRGGRKFDVGELLSMPALCEFREFPTFKAVLAYEKLPYIEQGKSFGFCLKIYDNSMSRTANWAQIRILTGKGLQTEGDNCFTMPLQNTYHYVAEQHFRVVLTEFHREAEDVFVEISLNGRSSFGLLRARLMVAEERDVIVSTAKE